MSFDLVFTTTVLIHIAPEQLQQAMTEIVRCADKYVLCGEYFAPNETLIPYRGQEKALWKRDYGSLYEKWFPGLTLIDQGFLSGAWDDVIWWLYERD
jgi:hypothetical protein